MFLTKRSENKIRLQIAQNIRKECDIILREDTQWSKETRASIETAFKIASLIAMGYNVTPPPLPEN